MLKHKSRKTLEQSFELRPEPQTEASKILFNKNKISKYLKADLCLLPKNSFVSLKSFEDV